MTPLPNNFFAVPVPKDAKNLQIYTDIINNWIIGYPGIIITLTTGSYTLLGKGDEITEQQAQMIVERDEDGYFDYKNDGFRFDEPYSLESFLSLLQSLSLEPGQVVIIKREK